MTTLKSFKQVIVEAPDRKILYEVLDTIMECSDKVSVVQFYNRKSTDNLVNEIAEQLEMDLDFSKHNKISHNENTELNPMGGRAQG